jgi:hypothetical protein
VFVEPHVRPKDVGPALDTELRALASWLELDSVERWRFS